LDLRARRVELQRHLVDGVRGLAVVCPPSEELVSGVLQLPLPPLEILAQLLPHRIGVALVHRLFDEAL
jgi:hypothetical protein